MSDFWSPLIGDIDENARREALTYRPGKGRKKEWGDHIGDLFTGRGAAMDKATEDAYVAELKRRYGVSVDDLNQTNGVDIGPITKDTDRDILTQKIEKAKILQADIKAANRFAAQNNVIVDPKKFNTPDSIITEVNRVVTEKAEAKEAAKETKEQTRRDEDVAWKKNRTTVQDKRYDLEQQRMWENRQANRKDRALTQQMNAENNAMQMQLEYSRLAQADATRAQDRKDKAIMALLSGLGNLAVGFTV